MRDHDPAGAGARILVYGPAGCGKSALIHRTVHWLQAQWREAGAVTQVVDLSDEVLLGAASEQKLRAHCALLAEALFTSGVVLQPEYDVLVARVDEPVLYTSALESLLRAKSVILLLILPRLDIVQDLDLFAQTWRRKRVVTFTESDEVDVHDRARSLYGVVSAQPIVACSVGTLRMQDGWSFVESRIALATRASGAAPLRIERDVLDAFMADRLSGGLAPSIRELQVTCQAVYERALLDSQEVVSLTDFGRHYMRLGRV